MIAYIPRLQSALNFCLIFYNEIKRHTVETVRLPDSTRVGCVVRVPLLFCCL